MDSSYFLSKLSEYPARRLSSIFTLDRHHCRELLKASEAVKSFSRREDMFLTRLFPQIKKLDWPISALITSLPSEKTYWGIFSLRGSELGHISKTHQEVALALLLGEMSEFDFDIQEREYIRVTRDIRYFDGVGIRGVICRTWSSSATLNLLLSRFKTNPSLSLSKKTANQHDDLIVQLAKNSPLVFQHLLKERD